VKLKWGEDPRIFSISSKEFLDDGNGNVKGIRTVQVEWKQDQSGRWNMSEVPNSEQIFEVFLFYSYSNVNDLQNAIEV
jgi:glutamate synthase (NADPH/NADH)